MSYSALEEMRKKNLERFGMDLGPRQPLPIGDEETGTDLKSAALRFLDKRCEGLRFSPENEELEKDGPLLGASLKPGQIPFNMQMDIDRLCLKTELGKFIDSGVADDAYTVYYAYLEMFFGEYGDSQKMVELLSEFESNASSLLMKHRDHYSHSVYVFALGLAIYETNPDFRKVFAARYGFEGREDSHEAAAFFLKYWGLTSLFHDIGYPFEIPFEQVLAYFEVDKKSRGEGTLFISYHNLEVLTAIREEERSDLEQMYHRSFADLYELLAHVISLDLSEAYGVSEEKILQTLRDKPSHPEKCGYYMDHAFFSAARLYQELNMRRHAPLQKAHMDALSAIMLHNSLFKFAMLDYKTGHPKEPLRMELHPLAWLLMLCDELQCWDRTAYGRNSRAELHPMSASFDFSGQEIHAVYSFDIGEEQKIRAYQVKRKVWEFQGRQGEKPKLKAYSAMAEDGKEFSDDIASIVDLSGFPLTVRSDLQKPDRKSKHTYLSSSSFLHIYDFAVALNARYSYQGEEDEVSTEQLEADFNSMSLEYKLYNINQVKSFARYLDIIDCFYTDKPVDYDQVTFFTSKMTEAFAPMEHLRWVLAHRDMGWQPGDEYEYLQPADGIAESRKSLREQMRRHKLTLPDSAGEEEILKHYEHLPYEEQGKDYLPFNSMLKLLQKYDGLRIYRLKED